MVSMTDGPTQPSRCISRRHGVLAIPQVPDDEDCENCGVLTVLTLTRLKTLNASQMSCSRALSPSGTLRVSRGSRETFAGVQKVFRPIPGGRLLLLLPSLFKSEFNVAEYG